MICEETKCDIQVFLKQHNELEIVSQTDNELPIGKSAEFQCKKGSRFIDGKTKIKPLTCSILNSEEMIASFSNTSESLCETIQCPGKEDLKSVTDKINVEILSIATNIAGKLEYQCIKDFKFLNFGALTRNTICVEKFENNKLEAEWQNGLTGCDQIYCQGIPKAPENSVVKKYAGFNISGNVKDGYFVANSNYYFSVSSNNSRSKFSGSFKCVQDGRTPIAK